MDDHEYARGAGGTPGGLLEFVVGTAMAFAGAYLAARISGLTPALAAAAGNRLAARVVQHRGAVIPVEAMADLLRP